MLEKINPEIERILNEFEIPVVDAMGFLIPLYYGFEPDYIPEDIIKKVYATEILKYDTELNLIWHISLFNTTTVTKFDWVKTEYCQLFKDKNPDCPSFATESLNRMIKLFKENPDIRKDEILGATKIFLNETEWKYIGHPHYFIEKGKGSEKVQKILSYIEKYREENEENNSSHTSRILQ